jgi:hypothetical protein
MGGLRTLKAIFNCVEHSAQVNEMLSASLPYLVNIGQKGVIQITQAATSGDSALASEGIEVMTSWSSVVSAVLEHYSVSDEHMMRQLLGVPELPSVLATLIVIVLPGDASLISTSSQPLAVKLNSIKTQAVQALNTAIEFLANNRKKTLEAQGVKSATTLGAEFPDSSYVQAARELAEPCINSLVMLCNLNDLEEVLQLESVSEMLVEILTMMCKTVSDRSFYPTYATYAKPLIVQVCLVLLRVTEGDIANFSESPQEFVTAAVDTCERQESETYKSASAQLAEGLCDYIDGALSFVVSFAIQAVDFVFTGKNFSTISNYKALEPFAQSVLLASPNEHIADVSLVILSVVSYAVEKRADLMKSVEDLLRAHLQGIVEAKSGLLSCRVCMLFYFYCEGIFENDDSAFIALFKFLLDCLIPTSHAKAVNIQACETLSYLVQDEEVQLRLDGMVGGFINFLVDSIPVQTETAFFDALLEILQSFSDSIDYPAHEITVRLVNKIEADTKEYLTRVQGGAKLKALDFTVIVKCYNCIRVLLEHETLAPEQLVSPKQLEVSQQLSRLVQALNEPFHGELDAELLKTINALLRRTRQITKGIWEVLPCLSAVQAKAGGIFGSAFSVLNKLIVWGADIFRSDPSSLQYVLQLCEVCLFAQPGNTAQEAKNAEAALIYQLMLQVLSPEMGQHLERVLTTVFSRYSQPISNNFLKIKLINTALCAISIDPQGTMALLARQQATESENVLAFLLRETCRLKEDYLHNYDKKVAVFGLCRLLQQEALLPEVVDSLKSLFEAIIAILNSTGSPPVTKAEERSQLDVMLDGIISDEDEISITGTNLFSMGVKTTDEREFNNTMSLFENPMYDSFDEYDCLRQMLSHLQTINPEALRVLVSPLPIERQKQLAELVQKRRVQTNVTSVRRIVKARHRTAKPN